MEGFILLNPVSVSCLPPTEGLTEQKEEKKSPPAGTPHAHLQLVLWEEYENGLWCSCQCLRENIGGKSSDCVSCIAEYFVLHCSPGFELAEEGNLDCFFISFLLRMIYDST